MKGRKSGTKSFCALFVALTTDRLSRIHPLSDRVLVQKIKPAEKTIGGIVLPDSAQSKINRAKVIAVGEKTLRCFLVVVHFFLSGKGRKNAEGTVLPMA